MRHFLKITDFTPEEAQSVFALAKQFKADRLNCPPALDRRSWGLLFYKSSTRTRVSFEVGINELGGFPVVLSSQNTQINRGETIGDTSKVLSRYLHGLVIRTFEHAIVEEFAAHASIPIVNGLTDFSHPCQLYTDLFTLLERYSPEDMAVDSLRGKKVAFLGDSACNMANSWILSAARFGMEIALAGPEGFEPGDEVRVALEETGLPVNYHFTHDAKEAAKDAEIGRAHV